MMASTAPHLSEFSSWRSIRAAQTTPIWQFRTANSNYILLFNSGVSHHLTVNVESSTDSQYAQFAAITPNYSRHLELDLDFLEKRHQNAHKQSTDKQHENEQQLVDSLHSQLEFSPEGVDRVKVIFLGPPAVGKTSIVQQFVWNTFCEDYQPTERKHTYYPSVISNDRLYEIKISDLPVIPYFPVNSYYEWTDFRFYGLRNASAYVLVFDLASLETFQYVKTLREQICESRNMSNVPMLVIGNKLDLITNLDDVAFGGASSTKALPAGGSSSSSSDLDRRRDIANLVRKHWKCAYMECSAKYNWKLVAAFRELMSMIDAFDIREQSPILDNLQEAFDRNKCVIL